MGFETFLGTRVLQSQVAVKMFVERSERRNELLVGKRQAKRRYLGADQRRRVFHCPSVIAGEKLLAVVIKLGEHLGTSSAQPLRGSVSEIGRAHV